LNKKLLFFGLSNIVLNETFDFVLKPLNLMGNSPSQEYSAAPDPYTNGIPGGIPEQILRENAAKMPGNGSMVQRPLPPQKGIDKDPLQKALASLRIIPIDPAILKEEGWSVLGALPVYVAGGNLGACVATHKRLVKKGNTFEEIYIVYRLAPMPEQYKLRNGRQVLLPVPRFFEGKEILKPYDMLVEAYWPEKRVIYVITSKGERKRLNLDLAKSAELLIRKTLASGQEVNALNAVRVALLILMRDYPEETITEIAFTSVKESLKDYGLPEIEKNVTSDPPSPVKPPTREELEKEFARRDSIHTDDIIYLDESKGSVMVDGAKIGDISQVTEDGNSSNSSKIGSEFDHLGARFGGRITTSPVASFNMGLNPRGIIRAGGGIRNGDFGRGDHGNNLWDQHRPMTGQRRRNPMRVVTRNGRRGYWRGSVFIPIPVGYSDEYYYVDDDDWDFGHGPGDGYRGERRGYPTYTDRGLSGYGVYSSPRVGFSLNV
jgi:hypothetical protein